MHINSNYHASNSITTRMIVKEVLLTIEGVSSTSFFNVTYWLNFLILDLMAPLLRDYKILLTILSLKPHTAIIFQKDFAF